MRLRRQVVKLFLLGSVILFIPYLMMSKLNGRQTNSDDILQNSSKTLLRHHNILHESDWLQNGTYTPFKKEKIDGLRAAMDYCNSPYKGQTSKEGDIIEGFKLRNVHVFIHHGDSTSNHRSDWFGPELFNCKFRTWYSDNHTKFKQFPDHMDRMAGKQGIRNHFLNWALYPDKDLCADSMLTSKGALQHLMLGQSLFETYTLNKDLFNEKLSINSQVYVKSTSSSRVYQSTVAFLYGFLPKFNISNMKIENSPDLHFCTKQFAVQKSCYCKHANKLKIKSMKIQSKCKGYDAVEKKHSDIMKEVFGNGILPSDFAMAEAIMPLFCHDITIPCWLSLSDKNCEEFLSDIWSTVIAQERARYNDHNLYYLKYSSIVMTPILIEIINRIKNIVENRHTPKFILYSGQESTLSPLLYVFSLQDGKWPPYASRVVIELYEHLGNISKNRFFLRFLYNGKDKTDSVIFCKGLTYKGLCSLRYFTDFVFTKMLRRFGFNSYYDACSR